MAVIQKKDEKAQSIFQTMKDVSSIDEFKALFKDMYANDWEKLWKEYKKEALRENRVLTTNNTRLKELLDQYNLYKAQTPKEVFTADENFEGINIANDISEAQELWTKAYKQLLDNSIGEEASRFLA
jgi:regulator of replication initiation timing